jgi:hypothetical protein
MIRMPFNAQVFITMTGLCAWHASSSSLRGKMLPDCERIHAEVIAVPNP